MIKYLLIHTFRRPEDGAYIRVKNLNLAITSLVSVDCREIILISLRYFREVFHNEKDSGIFQRRIFLPIIWTNRHLIARIWNRFSSWLVGMILALLFKPDIIVGENSSSWRLAWSVKSWRTQSRLIMDLHGASPEEILFHHPPSRWQKIAFNQESAFERDILLNSDFIMCQSDNMIEHLKSKYIDTHARFHSFQCSVRSDLFRYDFEMRSRYRQKLGVKDEDTLFVYCGSFHKWQNIFYSVDIFSEFYNNCAASSVFVIMCPNPGDELLEYAYELGLDDHIFKIIKVPHEEVSAYLNAADIGFLIRDDCVMNRVASPTKLGEYLACGLPVIVGDVAHYWPAANIDSTCFCFVDLGDAMGAANNIHKFLDSRLGKTKYFRERAISIAESVLSNSTETEKLAGFIKETIQWKTH